MSATSAARPSRGLVWTGWVLTALPAALLLFSAVMKLMKPQPVVEGFAHFGVPEHLILPLGIVELACTLVYLVPRTAVLGAILLTGYLGGATFANVRGGDSFVMTVGLGIVVWGGLFLRDPRVRHLIPLRSAGAPAGK
jgi:hypothetical protein